jgi:hypothetical protein
MWGEEFRSPRFAGGSFGTSSGHSLSITARISSEMAETFSISSMYLCRRRRFAGVITLPPTTRGELERWYRAFGPEGRPGLDGELAKRVPPKRR